MMSTWRPMTANSEVMKGVIFLERMQDTGNLEHSENRAKDRENAIFCLTATSSDLVFG